MLNTIIILICITRVPECLSRYWPDSDPGPCTTAKETIKEEHGPCPQKLTTVSSDAKSIYLSEGRNPPICPH